MRRVLSHMCCGPRLCRFDGLTKPVLFETVLMGPQLLRDAYGAGSVQLRTLIRIATHMIADLRAKLQAEYDDRVLVQVRHGAHCFRFNMHRDAPAWMKRNSLRSASSGAR